MAPVVRVRVTDRGWNYLRESVKRIAGGGVGVKAGIIGEASRQGEPLTNLTLAILHEFGAPGAGLPERPWIRAAFDANRAKYEAALLKGLCQVISAKDPKAALKRLFEALGLMMVADFQAYVWDDKVQPPQSPKTLARKIKKGAWNKGGASSVNKPVTLIDTAQMVGAVTHQVVMP